MGTPRGVLSSPRSGVAGAGPPNSSRSSCFAMKLLQAPACSSLGLAAGAGRAAEREAGASGRSVAKQELRDE